MECFHQICVMYTVLINILNPIAFLYFQFPIKTTATVK